MELALSLSMVYTNVNARFILIDYKLLVFILDTRICRNNKPIPKYKQEAAITETGEIKNSFPEAIAMCASITK